MNERKPQPGDRVRVTFEGTYHKADFSWDIYDISLDGSMLTTSVLRDRATVEVLEPVDDPSKDPIGTVRQRRGDEAVVRSYDRSDDPHPWRSVQFALSYRDSDVVDCEVIGSVPGTPAAEQSVTAEQVEQWETDDLELAVDPLKPVVLIQAEDAAGSRAPRVFQWDGPEPPPEADFLEFLDFNPDEHGVRYFKRFEDEWAWVAHPADRYPGPDYCFQWPPSLPGRYQEVLS